jgi:uncharacterized membrane protein
MSRGHEPRALLVVRGATGETLARELGRLEGEIRIRTELSEITESTLREYLERERERADKAEAAL